nr:clumping factor A-like [Lytechinus pictus]
MVKIVLWSKGVIMGSKGEKKSGLVGEKSHSVYSANWKLDAMLDKELNMLDTSKHRVEHRISMDQVVAQKRFQVKLHHSKVFHARVRGDREMLKKLITKDNYDFNTNTTSVDVLNKRREKDLAKKRVLHRQSQEKLMTFRTVTPTPAPSAKIPDLPGDETQQSKAEGPTGPTIRPMTAIERITHAKLLATGQGTKIRPRTAGVDITRHRTVIPNATKRLTPLSTSEIADRIRAIPEDNLKYVTGSGKNHADGTQKKITHDKNTSQEIIIEITKADDDDNAYKSEVNREDENNNKNISDSSTDPVETTHDDKTSPEIIKTDTEKGLTKDSGSDSKIALKKSILRPKTAIGTSSRSEKGRTSAKPARPRTSLKVSEGNPSDQSDNESTSSGNHRRRSISSNTGRCKSAAGKSKRKKSAVSIFSDEKSLTIMDIDEARHQRAQHGARIQEYVNSLDSVKTDPDEFVDYYMARLLEESSISGTQKNVERIRDMPDSDYDVDLARRSMGNMKANTITFRDVNRNYDDYEHDPYTPLHPTSMAYGLASRASTTGGIAQHDSLISIPTSAWQGNDSDTDSD